MVCGKLLGQRLHVGVTMWVQLPAGDAQVETQPRRMAATAAVPLDVLVAFLASTHPGKRREWERWGGRLRDKVECAHLRLYSQIYSETGTRNGFVRQRLFRTILDYNFVLLYFPIFYWWNINQLIEKVMKTIASFSFIRNCRWLYRLWIVFRRVMPLERSHSCFLLCLQRLRSL